MRPLHLAWLGDCAVVCPRASVAEARDLGHELLDRWSEGARAYHCTTHLAEVLAALTELTSAGLLRGLDVSLARMAAWFHDAVYDPRAGAGANEAASAALARHTLGRLNAAPHHVERVVDLVEMTVDHDPQGIDPVTDAFHDADLWILASPPARFDEYTLQIRAEYAQVSALEFARGRRAVLATFLARDPIYRTPHAQAAWDPQARVNLARSVAVLSEIVGVRG